MFFFLSSCTNTTFIQEDSKTINIDVAKSIKFFDADKLLDTIGHEIIVLDTAKNSFIGHVNKLLVTEDKLYIWDRDNKVVFIYSPDGKYLSRIASQGRAKNEYVDIDDFYVSKNRIYILDNATMRLLEYDITGGYIKTLDISRYWANGVFSINDMIYLINYASETDNGQYHIFKIDNNGNLKDKYLEFDKKYRNTPHLKAYSEVNHVFSLCMSPVNEIYRIDSISCQLAYRVNFVNKNLPEKYYEKDLRALIQAKIPDKYILGVDQIQESSNYLFIYFWDNWEYYTALYDKTNDHMTVCKGILISSMYRMGFGDYYIHNNCVYSIVEASLFKILVEEIIKKNSKSKDKYITELEKINQEITDYSNPVIIKYKLKS